MFEDKTILITGGTGTLGYAIVERLLTENPREIRVFSRNEEKQIKMSHKYPMVKYYLGAVENLTSLEKAVAGSDVIFHLAAMKYLDLAEKHPYQAVMANIIGSLNIIQLAMKYNVGKVIGTSTDKAVSPSSLYGMTKRTMEYLFLWANLQPSNATEFYVVRFGNLFGSSGSVVEIWYNASRNNDKLRVTNPEMTRFYFGVNDAASLMWETLRNEDPNAIYSVKMKTLKTGKLAEKMQSNGVEIIGNRGGEKSAEGLISPDETCRTETLKWGNLDVFKIGQKKLDTSIDSYTTDNAPPMNDDEIDKLLNDYKISVGA